MVKGDSVGFVELQAVDKAATWLAMLLQTSTGTVVCGTEMLVRSTAAIKALPLLKEVQEQISLGPIKCFVTVHVADLRLVCRGPSGAK